MKPVGHAKTDPTAIAYAENRHGGCLRLAPAQNKQMVLPEGSAILASRHSHRSSVGSFVN